MNTSQTKIGDRITGRCVTIGSTYTGRVVQVIDCPGESYPRYRLADTGAVYRDGSPICPIVHRIA